MMQVTGEDGVTLDDYVTYQKSLFLDMVYLQQDAFDAVDSSTPLERQRESFELVNDLVTRGYKFANKSSARDYFTHLIGLYKNLNYSRKKSSEYKDYLQEIYDLADAVTLSELSQLE